MNRKKDENISDQFKKDIEFYKTMNTSREEFQKLVDKYYNSN